jgi:hypothetical protein
MDSLGTSACTAWTLDLLDVQHCFAMRLCDNDRCCPAAASVVSTVSFVSAAAFYASLAAIAAALRSPFTARRSDQPLRHLRLPATDLLPLMRLLWLSGLQPSMPLAPCCPESSAVLMNLLM